MHSGLRIGINVGGQAITVGGVHLSGALNHSFVEHCGLPLHHVVMSPEGKVHTVLPQKRLNVVDEQVHNGDVAGLGAAVVGVQVHSSVAVEDDPRSDCAMQRG